MAEMGLMALPRTLEPEVMDTEQEARDYDAMDHGDVNARFCDDLLALGVRLGRVLDVGTGPGLIPIELCRRAPAVEVDAIDLAAHMLALAERNVARAGLAGRIRVARVDAKATGRADGVLPDHGRRPAGHRPGAGHVHELRSVRASGPYFST